MALATMRRLMGRLGLTVNDQKTRIACLPEEAFDFLGYTVGRFYGKDGRAFIGTEPSLPDKLPKNSRACRPLRLSAKS
jgi:RNA-directed DNA polymerase